MIEQNKNSKIALLIMAVVNELEKQSKFNVSEIKRSVSRTYRIKQTIQDLDDFIAKNTPDMRNILESYYAAEQNAITRKALSDLMGFNVAGTELRKIFQQNTDYLKDGLSYAWLTAMKEQMKKISDIIKGWLGVPYLASANQRLLNYIDLEALQLAVSLSSQRYLVLGDLLSFFAANDIGLGTAVELMKANMVLTPKMAEWIRKAYVKNLNSGMTKADALRLAKKKSEYLKDWRARTQIRTELNRAKHYADKEALKQGIERGLLQNVYKTWIRTAYNDNHQNSIDNDGITVPLDGLFSDGSDIPGEINERCILEYLMIRGE